MGFNENLNLIEKKVKFAKIKKKKKIKNNINQKGGTNREILSIPNDTINIGGAGDDSPPLLNNMHFVAVDNQFRADQERARARLPLIQHNFTGLNPIMQSTQQRTRVDSTSPQLNQPALSNSFPFDPVSSATTSVAPASVAPAALRQQIPKPKPMGYRPSADPSTIRAITAPSPTQRTSVLSSPLPITEVISPHSQSTINRQNRLDGVRPISYSTSPSPSIQRVDSISSNPAPSTAAGATGHGAGASTASSAGAGAPSPDAGDDEDYDKKKLLEDIKPLLKDADVPYPKELKMIPKKYPSDKYAKAALELEKNETKEATSNLSKYISDMKDWNDEKHQNIQNKIKETAQKEMDLILGIQHGATRGFWAVTKQLWQVVKSTGKGMYNIARLPQVVMIFYVIIVFIILICIILFIINLGSNNNNNSSGLEIRGVRSAYSTGYSFENDFETSILPSLSWNGFAQSPLSHLSNYVAGQFSKYKYDFKYIQQKLSNLNFNIKNSPIVSAVTGNSPENANAPINRNLLSTSNDNIEYIDKDIMVKIDPKYSGDGAKPLLKPKNIQINFPYDDYINEETDMSKLTEEEKNIYNEDHKRSINDTDNIIFKWKEVKDGTYTFNCDPIFVNNDLQSNLLEETPKSGGGRECTFKTI